MNYLIDFLLAGIVLYVAFVACIVVALVVHTLRDRGKPTPPPPPASAYLPSVEPVRKLAPVRSQAERVSSPKESSEQWLRSQAVRANGHIAELDEYRSRRGKGA